MMRRTILAVMLAMVVACVLPARAGEPARVSLAKRVSAAKMADIPLSDALDFVRDLAGVNIDVDWKTLEAAGIARDTPIAIDVHDVTAGRLLKLILAIAGQKEPLTAYIDDNIVEITTLAADDAHMITKVYDVTDLISLDDHFNPIASVGSNMSGMSSMSGSSGSTSGNGQTGANSNSSFGNSNNNNNNSSGSNSNGTSNKETKANHLIQVIQAAVRPEIWQINGGKATIVYFNNQLIVSAPRSVQRLIGG